jgi:hypothetical protein
VKSERTLAGFSKQHHANFGKFMANYGKFMANYGILWQILHGHMQLRIDHTLGMNYFHTGTAHVVIEGRGQ